MHICIEGCAHGDLQHIYQQIFSYEASTQKKVDLLICCGDFQATRNLEDLACMAVPPKYLDMCSFYKYYSGELKAPILTIFIGGNHEASNHLQELSYGGWVAPNIYYLGYAGVININGVRIAGISGIFRGYHFRKGHFEFPPYSEDTMRSAYAIRVFEVFRLMQLTPSKIDIMLSHDWPSNIWNHGNNESRFGSKEKLLRLKPAFKTDMDSGKLGSQPCWDILRKMKPKNWFAAHLHCRFDALVHHNETEKTKFVALDKCIHNRNFFEFIDIGDEAERNEHGAAKLKMEYDAEWLAILSSTNKFLNCSQEYSQLPREPLQQNSPSNQEQQRWNFTPKEEEIQLVLKKFNNDLTIPLNFKQTELPYCPQDDGTNFFRKVKQPPPKLNIQTTQFCEKLLVDDPLFVATSLQNVVALNPKYDNDNDDAFKDINQSEDDENEQKCKQQKPKYQSLTLPKPTNDEEINLSDFESEADSSINKSQASDDIEPLCKTDTAELKKPSDESKQSRDLESEEQKESKSENVPKKFKRRNQDIYATAEDD